MHILMVRKVCNVTFINVCINIYTYTYYVCACLFLCWCVYLCVHVCVYIWVCAGVPVCILVWVCVFFCVYVCPCVNLLHLWVCFVCIYGYGWVHYCNVRITITSKMHLLHRFPPGAFTADTYNFLCNTLFFILNLNCK